MLDERGKTDIKSEYFNALVKASDVAANKLMDAGVPELEAYEQLLEWDIMSVASLVHVIARFKGNATLVGRHAEESLAALIEQEALEPHEGLPKRHVII